jgi:hypothetical protein
MGSVSWFFISFFRRKTHPLVQFYRGIFNSIPMFSFCYLLVYGPVLSNWVTPALNFKVMAIIVCLEIWSFFKSPVLLNLHGVRTNQCIWRQRYPQLVHRIQTHLVKDGYIAWREGRVELQSFLTLIGLGKFPPLWVPSYFRTLIVYYFLINNRRICYQ